MQIKQSESIRFSRVDLADEITLSTWAADAFVKEQAPELRALRDVFSTAGGGWKQGFWHSRGARLQTSRKPISGQRRSPQRQKQQSPPLSIGKH